MRETTNLEEFSPILQKQIRAARKSHQQELHFKNTMIESKYREHYLAIRSTSYISRLTLIDNIFNTFDEHSITDELIVNEANELLLKAGIDKISNIESIKLNSTTHNIHQDVALCSVALLFFEEQGITMVNKNVNVNSDEISGFNDVELSQEMKKNITVAKIRQAEERLFHKVIQERYKAGYSKWSQALSNPVFLPDYVIKLSGHTDIYQRYVEVVEFVSSSSDRELTPLVQSEFASLIRQAQNGEVIVRGNYHILCLLCSL